MYAVAGAAPTLDNTLGAVQLGVFFSGIIFGSTTQHLYYYYHYYWYDSHLHKSAVAILWILDAFHLSLTIEAAYNYGVRGFGDVVGLQSIRWSVKVRALPTSECLLIVLQLLIAINVVIILLVQGLYAYRVWKLSGIHNGVLGYLVAAVVLGGFAIGIVTAVEVYGLDVFADVTTISWAIEASLATSTTIDFLNAAAMCFYLAKSKGSGSALNSRISGLINYTLSCGVFTSACSISTLIAFILMPYNMIFLALTFILTRFYVNSFMSLMIARPRREATEHIITADYAPSGDDVERATMHLPYSFSGYGSVIQRYRSQDFESRQEHSRPSAGMPMAMSDDQRASGSDSDLKLDKWSATATVPLPARTSQHIYARECSPFNAENQLSLNATVSQNSGSDPKNAPCTGSLRPQPSLPRSNMSSVLPAVQKTIGIRQHGDFDVLEALELPLVVGSDQIVVKTEWIGVNFIDTYFRKGLYPLQLPAAVGQEISGTIVALPTDPAVLEDPEYKLRNFALGARVSASERGAAADYAALAWKGVFVLPDGVSTRIGAAARTQGTTVLTFIEEAYNVQKGDTILVHTVAGGLGLLFAQLIKLRGATVIGTTSTPEKAAIAKANGAEHVILYKDEDVVARVLEITKGAGVEAVFDGVGKDTFDSDFEMLKRKGTLVSVGNASGAVPPFQPLRLAQKNIKLVRPIVGNYMVTPAEIRHYASELFSLIAEQKLQVQIHKEYPFTREGVIQAQKDLTSGHTVGKLLLKVE
uniref:NAD(P)-binding protein n=1 Tax=Mycena chlorophos TaxID=658473 RepID=A0ABQ0MCI3_MYCCL|nr:NAD(P)-binding protein [Mycena chlorophos]